MRLFPIVAFVLALGALGCGPAPRPAGPTPASDTSELPPALAEIREDELRQDLLALAGDEMRGREAGTVDELRASAWLAERAREAGLQPAGDDGTFFQFWPMRVVRLAPESRVAVGGVPLALGEEAVVVSPTAADVDAPLVHVGRGREDDVAGRELRGAAVVAELSAPDGAPPLGRHLTPRRYAMLAVRQRAAFLTERGPAAVVLVSDSVADPELRNIGAGWMRGQYSTAERDAGSAGVGGRPPVIWVPRAMLDRLRLPGQRLVARLATESFVVPSVNVIARVPGTEPALGEEHVLYSAHQDGLGVRYAWDGDSIWNGADDNASTSVALLAIGRAFAARPARRSVLFVWHGAEEVGLLGSRWHSAHPVLPLRSLIAVLNGDMIGANHPDTAALLGSQAANRTSQALVAAALRANDLVARFAIDSTWDRPGHPESFFRRSDHWSYVEKGVPAVYFSTLLHPDYHTPRDEPQRIDYRKLTRMTRWMYATGWAVANARERPALDTTDAPQR